MVLQKLKLFSLQPIKALFSADFSGNNLFKHFFNKGIIHTKIKLMALTYLVSTPFFEN